MRTLFALVVAINIILNVVANTTFEDLKTEVEKNPSVLPDENAQKDIAKARCSGYFLEGCGLAYLMFTLGTGLYLPEGKRTEAILICGGGSGFTLTGVMGFTRLQEELIAKNLVDSTVQPYTKVTVTITREACKSDKLQRKEPRKAYKNYEYLIILLNKLKIIMETNSYVYADFEQECPPETTINTFFETPSWHAELSSFMIGQNPSNIAMVMDIMMGIGKKEDNTADKAHFNLRLIKYLSEKKVPVFLYDGKSCSQHSDHAEFDLGSTSTYGVDAVLPKGGQGLIVTSETKYKTLSGLVKGDCGFSTKEYDGPIIVAHVRTLITNDKIFAQTMTYEAESLNNIFDRIYVENLGTYYRKKSAAKPS